MHGGGGGGALGVGRFDLLTCHQKVFLLVPFFFLLLLLCVLILFIGESMRTEAFLVCRSGCHSPCL